MAERQSAFASLMSYVGGDELLRQHPLVAEFVGATVRSSGVSLLLRGVACALACPTHEGWPRLARER